MNIKNETLKSEFMQVCMSSIGNRDTAESICNYWLKKLAEREAELLAFKGQRSREDYMRGYEESREKLIEAISEDITNYDEVYISEDVRKAINRMKYSLKTLIKNK